MGELYALLLAVLTLPYPGSDPALEAWKGRRALRSLECERVPQAQAHKLRPGRVPEPAARGETLLSADALVCSRRLVPYGEHPARDELILSSLRERISAITQSAIALGNAATNWHVDAFYPDVDVGMRIAAAGRTDLAERGLKVSNQVPLLAAGDLLVLRTLDIREAMPLACERYFAEGSMTGADDAFLGIALVDAHESQLHAGVCINRTWRWLR